jgi:hypothetical protein
MKTLVFWDFKPCPIVVTLMMEMLSSSETSVLTRAVEGISLWSADPQKGCDIKMWRGPAARRSITCKAAGDKSNITFYF